MDKEVGEFVNGHFLSLHVNTLDPDGPLIRKQYRVRGNPTVLFLTPAGVEIDRICGFSGDKNACFQQIREIARGENTLRSLLAGEAAAPADVALQYRLGKKYLARWESEQALPHLQAVLRLDPRNSKGFNPECTCLLAIRQADAKQDIQPLRDFIATGPERSLLAKAYVSLANYHVRKKDPAAVVATYEAALEKLPAQPDLMRDYSAAIFELKIEAKYPRGIGLARELVDIVPDKPNAYLELGYLYQAMKDFQRARETFLKCRELYPGNMSAVYQLGKNALLSGKDLAEGLACFEQYLKHPPEGPSWAAAHWRMGMIQEQLGHTGQAIAEYEAALAMDPSLKDAKEAKEALEKLGLMIDVGGRRLHCSTYGQGPPTVVLVSGLECPRDYWNPVIPGLAAKTTVVTYDRPGIGKSEIGELPNHGEQSARDLRVLLGKLGVPKPYILVGHSFGGGIVRLFAAMYPGDTGGLILEETQHEDGLDEIRKILKGKDLETFEQDFLPRFQAPASPRTERDYRQVTHEQLRNSQPLPRIPFVVLVCPGRARSMRAMFSEEAIEEMVRVDAALMSRLAALIPGGRLVWVEGTGHEIHVDKPESLIMPLGEMIDEVRQKRQD